MKKGTATIFFVPKEIKNSRCPLFLFFLYIFFIIFALVSIVNAQEEKKEEIPPKGMEIRDVGSTKMLVPKDMKLTEGQGLIIREDLAEYLSRVVADMQERIAKVESGFEEMKNDIAELKKELAARPKELTETKQETDKGG